MLIIINWLSKALFWKYELYTYRQFNSSSFTNYASLCWPDLKSICRYYFYSLCSWHQKLAPIGGLTQNKFYEKDDKYDNYCKNITSHFINQTVLYQDGLTVFVQIVKEIQGRLLSQTFPNTYKNFSCYLKCWYVLYNWKSNTSIVAESKQTECQ